jgi:hypothetical protein
VRENQGHAGAVCEERIARGWIHRRTRCRRHFRPVDQLVADADQRLRDVEGRSFEKLVGVLYEERSHERIGDFPLSEWINGYWDLSDREIDLVALNATDRIIGLGSCKRSQRNWSATYPSLAAMSSAPR